MMKMKMFTMLFAMSVSATTVFAQKGVDDGSRFGHGQDSIRCLSNISIYSENVKVNNFADAYKPWKAVFTEAPLAQVSTYTNGAKILRFLIQNAKDAAQQKTYFNELMAVYDQRLKYLDQLNQLVRTPDTPGEIMAYKVHDYISFAGPSFDVRAAYEMSKKAIDDSKEASQSFALLDFMDLATQLLKKDPNYKQQYIQDYLATAKYAEEAYKAASDAKKEAWKSAVDNVNAYFVSSGAASCDNLQAIYGPQVQQNKTNIEFLKQVLNIMQMLKCTEQQAYFDAAEAANAIEPTAATATGCAYMFYKKGDIDKSLEYFEQAMKLESDDLKKSDLAYSVAVIMFKRHQYSQARQYANRALQYNGKDGKPLILIAQMYAASANWSDEAAMNKCTYFAAIDKLQRAKSIDPNIAGEANRLIGQYSAHTPKKEDLFFLGLKPGAAVTIGGWIGETTTIR